MTAETLPAPAAPATPTLSLIYEDSDWDWKDASEVEIRIEAGYLRAWLAREDSAAAREELKRVQAAAKELRITI